MTISETSLSSFETSGDFLIDLRLCDIIGSKNGQGVELMFTPFRLMSLLEMLVDFPISSLFLMLSRFQAVQVDLRAKDGKGEELDSEYLNGLNLCVTEIEEISEIFNIDVSDCVSALRKKIHNPETSNIPMWTLWRDLRKRVSHELKKHLFMYIPEVHKKYYNQEMLFGIEVDKKFPKARDEIRNAGNCLATGNYTACVFHLMRTVEHGLRQTAKQLKVPFPSTYELKTWEQLLKAIETEIGKIVLQPKTPKRAKDLQFFNPMPLEFRFFKDAWRNHVMHTRAEYDEHQAMSIMVHVRELMQHIAIGKER